MYGAEENSGNYFPFKLDDSYKGKPITVKRTSTSASAKTVTDTEWILRLTDGTDTKYEISSGDTKIADLSFDGASLASSPEIKANVEKVSDSNVPQDSNAEKCKVNQNAITVSKSGNEYSVSGNISEMQEYRSTDPGQQDADHKWFCLIIDTGETDIQNVTVDGNKLTAKDVEEATSVGAKAGSFVLWLKADVLKDSPRTLKMQVDGKADTTIKITFKDVGDNG